MCDLFAGRTYLDGARARIEFDLEATESSLVTGNLGLLGWPAIRVEDFQRIG